MLVNALPSAVGGATASPKQLPIPRIISRPFDPAECKTASFVVIPKYAAVDDYLGSGGAPDSRCLTSVSWFGQMAGTTILCSPFAS